MPEKAKDPYTGSPWRDLGHVRWRDPLAALEVPESKEFKAAVATEDAQWSHNLQQIPPARLNAWKKSMHRFQDAAHPVGRAWAEIEFTWCGHRVSKQTGVAGYTTHLWIDDWHLDRTWSSVGFGNAGWFYTLEDIGKGAEHLELTVWNWSTDSTMKEPIPVWRKDPVGPSVEIVGDQIYFSTVENLLRYPDIWVAPVRTGHSAKCLFTEPDARYQVTFTVRDGTFFINKANALDQMLGILVDGTVSWITGTTATATTATTAATLLPIAAEWYGSNNELVHFVTGTHIPLPRNHWLVDGCKSSEEGQLLVVLVSKGRDSLWTWQKGWRCIYATPKSLNAIQMFHDPTPFPTLLLRAPMTPDTVWVYRKGMLSKTLAYPEPLKLPYFGSGSTREGGVPYTWVSAVSAPKALLVEAYGAYGISARRAYPVRWLPYIAAGWAVAYICPRGGRDDGDAWWDAGRTAARKHHTFDDTAAGIVAVQRALRIPPAATVFFGRSAGGWLAANIAQEHGKLVAAVYAEVPYVDVLRTTSNPRLPLTQLEYDEFGDPRKPSEYRALKKISPIDTVPSCKNALTATCPLLVIRTALHDKQVLPYEVLKWSSRLRAAGWPRVNVGIDHDGGHFAAAKSMAEQRAEDAALLETAITYQGARTSNTRRKKSAKRSHRLTGTMGRTRRLRSTSS